MSSAKTYGSPTCSAGTPYSEEDNKTNCGVASVRRQSVQAYDQAVMVRAHVDSMRQELEASLMYLAEAKQAFAARELPETLS